jgi:hypothetical protein
MRRREVLRGLLKAALKGRISSAQGAVTLQLRASQRSRNPRQPSPWTGGRHHEGNRGDPLRRRSSSCRPALPWLPVHAPRRGPGCVHARARHPQHGADHRGGKPGPVLGLSPPLIACEHRMGDRVEIVGPVVDRATRPAEAGYPPQSGQPVAERNHRVPAWPYVLLGKSGDSPSLRVPARGFLHKPPAA